MTPYTASPWTFMNLENVNAAITIEQARINQSIELQMLENQLMSERPMIYQLQDECCITKDIPKKSNCKNCGASLEGRHGCSYCGTYNE